jgi:hypothetical protein
MKFKVAIEASFVHEVEVDAQTREEAEARASDALMDYLDQTLSNSRKFAEFHEYVLKERIVSVVEADTGCGVAKGGASSPVPNTFRNKVVLIGWVVALAFCLFVFVVDLCTLPTLFR